MELLKFRVINQHLAGGRYRPVSGSIDYIEAVFDFTPDWNGLDKWAHFSKGETVYDVNLAGDKITKDMHLNLDAGIWEVKLHGDANENGEVVMRITTDSAYITVEDFGALHEGGVLPEVSADSASIIAAKAQEALDIANSVKAAAEAGEFDGDKLPEVTENDNGKVLGVANGVWDKISAAMGGSGAVKWNDILEKPFYYEKNAAILEAEFKDALKDSDGDGTNDSWEGQMFFEDNSEATLEPGKVYTVSWNGEEYECICQSFQGLPALGNYAAVGGEDTGEPFALARDKNDLLGMGSSWVAVLVNVPEDITASGTYSCRITGEKVKQLDNEFVPAPPVFDLEEMGFAPFSVNGGEAELETDTSEIRSALAKGAVTFRIPLEAYGSIFYMYFTAYGLGDRESTFQCVGFAGISPLMAITIMVVEDEMMIAMVPLNTVIGMPEASTDDNGKIMRIENGEWTVSEETEKPIPSNVDLSVFESEGIITENYPDGSSVTYTFEFDSEGNPVKITDSSGNETVLGW